MSIMNDNNYKTINIIRGYVRPVEAPEALYLIKKTKEFFSSSKEKEDSESVYMAMIKIAAKAGMRVPFEEESFYMIYNAVKDQITWDDIIATETIQRGGDPYQVPLALIDEMEKRFESNTHTVLIAEAEKFIRGLVPLIKRHENCHFVLTAVRAFHVQMLSDMYADMDNVEVIEKGIYDYEFIPRKFDLILSSPALGGRAIDKDGQFICREYDLVALENLLLHLNPGGRLAIVVAARLTFADGKVKDLRDFVQSMYRLEEIDELPEGLFAPYTNIKMYLLSITTGKTDDVEIKKLTAIGEGRRRVDFRIKELKVEDSTFVMEDELRDLGNWSIDRIFAMQSEEWEEYQSSSIPKNRLEDVAEIFRGRTVTHQESEGDIGVVNITNIRDLDIDYENLNYINEDKNRVGRYILEKGDVLFPARGTAIRVGVYDDKTGPEICIPSANVITVRPDPTILNSTYLKIFLDSDLGRSMLMGMQQGTTVVNISYRDLGGMEIPTPPIEEQERIVQKYESELAIYQDAIHSAEERWNSVIEEIQEELKGGKS